MRSPTVFGRPTCLYTCVHRKKNFLSSIKLFSLEYPQTGNEKPGVEYPGF